MAARIRSIENASPRPAKRMCEMGQYEICYCPQGVYGGCYVRRVRDIFVILGHNDYYEKDCTLEVRDLGDHEKITVEYSWR